MNEFLEIMQNWGGIVLLLVLAVIGIVCSLAGSSSAEERRLNGKDEDHYVIRLPIGRISRPLGILIAGFVLEFLSFLLEKYYLADSPWIMLAIRLGVAAVFGIWFWRQLAKVLRERVFVNGERIIYTPAVGAPIETTFKQIRTVANKLAGKDRGVIGKKIRTKEGNRFEVINTMSGYDRFCEQLEEKVELPDLTKKLFKKRDKDKEKTKKDAPVAEPEEVVSTEPLPQASPAVAAAAVETVPESQETEPEDETWSEPSEPEEESIPETEEAEEELSEPEEAEEELSEPEEAEEESAEPEEAEEAAEEESAESEEAEAEEENAEPEEEQSEAGETEEELTEPEETMPDGETPETEDTEEPLAAPEEAAEEPLAEPEEAVREPRPEPEEVRPEDETDYAEVTEPPKKKHWGRRNKD